MGAIYLTLLLPLAAFAIQPIPKSSISPRYTRADLEVVARRGEGYLMIGREAAYYWIPGNLTKVSDVPNYPDAYGGNPDIGYYLSLSEDSYYYLGKDGAWVRGMATVPLPVASLGYPYTEFTVTSRFAIATDKTKFVFRIVGKDVLRLTTGPIRNIFVFNDIVYGFNVSTECTVVYDDETKIWSKSPIQFPDAKLMYAGTFESRITIAFALHASNFTVQQYDSTQSTWNVIFRDDSYNYNRKFICLANSVCFFYSADKSSGVLYQLENGKLRDTNMCPQSVGILGMVVNDTESTIIVSGVGGFIAIGKLHQGEMTWKIEDNGINGEVLRLVEIEDQIIAWQPPNLYSIAPNLSIAFYGPSQDFSQPPMKEMDCGAIPEAERIGNKGQTCFIGINKTHLLLSHDLKEYHAYPVPLYLKEEGELYRAVVMGKYYSILQYHDKSRTAVYVVGETPLPRTLEGAKDHYSLIYNSSLDLTRDINSNGESVALLFYTLGTPILMSYNGIDYNDTAIYNGNYDVGQVTTVSTYTGKPFVIDTLRLNLKSPSFTISADGKHLTNITGYYDRLVSGIYYSPHVDIYIATYDDEAITFKISRDLRDFSPLYTLSKNPDYSQIIDCKAMHGIVKGTVSVVCCTHLGDVLVKVVPLTF